MFLNFNGLSATFTNFEVLGFSDHTVNAQNGMSIAFSGDLSSIPGLPTRISVSDRNGGGTSIDASQLTSNNYIRLSGSIFDDVIHGGAGNDEFTGLGGNDTFIFSPGGGMDTLFHFDYGAVSDDRIDLSDFELIDFNDQVSNHATQQGSNLHIDFGTDKLILENVSIADLHEDDFILDRTVDGHELIGTDAENLLIGTTRSDEMTGGSGADAFLIIHGDTGDNAIVDFNKAEGDVLDLKSLFSQDEPIDEYLDFSFDATNTNLHIDVDRDGTVDTTTQSNGVDLVGSNNDVAIIDTLIINSNLDVLA